ncbi:hypothetical protein H9636_02690 [Ureibacillus sp. Re31]|uniref:Uncharacterized protein n=1 Tax=Ureibacillus galli TaxID=2762222 RepID=A0ABR8X8Q0_9BACL|nr:hypothetical protein [Ureibacillus galli]MBD8025558.1 hypothetical protein [Ureibacillus galli]
MTEQELKYLFKKQIPAAHKSLQEAYLMPEGEAKRYKIEAAMKHIEKGHEILEKCFGKWNFKDELILIHKLENFPIERTASIFYGESDPNAIKKLKALENFAYKRLYKCLTTLEATQEAEDAKIRQSMSERLKARQQRVRG